MRYIIGLFALCLMSCQSSLTEAAFFTEGSCAACAARVEKALSNHPGLEQMRWDQENQMTLVLYHADKTSLEDLQQKVADAGFNTQYFDANPASRDTLLACCEVPSERRSLPSHPSP